MIFLYHHFIFNINLIVIQINFYILNLIYQIILLNLIILILIQLFYYHFHFYSIYIINIFTKSTFDDKFLYNYSYLEY